MKNNFLYQLNGKQEGAFKKFLDEHGGQPRVCWYPSCGTDFRAPMFLSETYSNLSGLSKYEDYPKLPDLFLYTDNHAFHDFKYDQSYSIIHQDKRTSVTIVHTERLPDLTYEYDEKSIYVDKPDRKPYTHQVYFMQVQIESNRLGTILANVLYCFCINEDFYSNVIFPNKAQISHLIRIRWGSGFGGSRGSGNWVRNLFNVVGAELFIDDRSKTYRSVNGYFLDENRELTNNDYKIDLRTIHIVPSIKWSWHGDVYFSIKNKVAVPFRDFTNQPIPK